MPSVTSYFCLPSKYLSGLREAADNVSRSRGLASHIDRQANWKSSATLCHLIVFSISAVTPEDASRGL